MGITRKNTGKTSLRITRKDGDVFMVDLKDKED